MNKLVNDSDDEQIVEPEQQIVEPVEEIVELEP